MSEPTLLGPGGSPMAQLGGDTALKQYVKGDIVASLQWIDLRPYGCYEEDGPEAVLALFSTRMSLGAGAKIIRQRDAWVWADRSGNARRVCINSAMDAAEVMGFDRNDQHAVRRIISIVLDIIPELVEMPSEQPAALEVKAALQGIETTIRMGGNIVHQEVR